MVHQDFFFAEFISELQKETAMSSPYSQDDYRNELRNARAEPLLPVEKKLISFSLGIGLVLLIVLAIVNHVYSG